MEENTGSGTQSESAKASGQRIRSLEVTLASVDLTGWDKLGLSPIPAGVKATGQLNDNERRAVILLNHLGQKDADLLTETMSISAEHLGLHVDSLRGGQGGPSGHDCSVFTAELDKLFETHLAVSQQRRNVERVLSSTLAFDFNLPGSGALTFYAGGEFLFSPGECQPTTLLQEADPSEMSSETREMLKKLSDGIESSLPAGVRLGRARVLVRRPASKPGSDMGGPCDTEKSETSPADSVPTTQP